MHKVRGYAQDLLVAVAVGRSVPLLQLMLSR